MESTRQNTRQKQNMQHLLPRGYRISPRYTVNSILRVTSTGIFYLCADATLPQMVCIKEIFFPNICTRLPNGSVGVIPNCQAYWTQSLQNLKRLVQISGNFNFQEKQGVPAIKDLVEANYTLYLVLEQVEGQPLGKILHEKGKWTRDQLKENLATITMTLKAYHAAGLCYGLLTPDQIVWTGDGKYRLNDVGGLLNPSDFSGKTIAAGKKPFIPPEYHTMYPQLGMRSDEFSFASVVYFCLSGKGPADSYSRMKNNSLASLGYRTLDKALSLNREDRYPGIAVFCEYFYKDIHVKERRRRQRKPFLFIALFALVIITCELLWFDHLKKAGLEYLEVNSDEYYEKGDEVKYSDVDLSHYLLVNAQNPGLVIGLENDSYYDGAALVLKDNDGDATNIVALTDQIRGDDYFNLTSLITGKYLQTRDSSKAGSALVQTSFMTDSGSNEWKMVYGGKTRGHDTFLIENKSGTVIGISGGKAVEGSSILLQEADLSDASQKWMLLYDNSGRVQDAEEDYMEYLDNCTLPDGTYQIVSASDGKTMLKHAGNQEGIEILGAVCNNNWSTGIFEIESLDNGMFRIKAADYDNLYLTVEDDARGEIDFEKLDSSSDRQIFQIIYTGHRSYYIANPDGTAVLGYKAPADETTPQAVYMQSIDNFNDCRKTYWILETAE